MIQFLLGEQSIFSLPCLELFQSAIHRMHEQVLSRLQGGVPFLSLLQQTLQLLDLLFQVIHASKPAALLQQQYQTDDNCRQGSNNQIKFHISKET